MIPAPQTADEKARDRIRHSLGESLLVEAAAGTGKTSELVWRIVNVLRAGLATVDRIVAVTFTNKAAGELKLRLRQELDRARARAEDAAGAAHLEHALAHLEEAAIGTIHSFCAQILRERPVEARVDPDFEELDEQGSRRVYDQVFRRWMQEKLNEDAPGLRRVLARLATERDSDFTPMESIQNAGWKIIEWRDCPKAWTRPELDRETIVDGIAGHIEAIQGELRRFPRELAEPVRDTLPWIERRPRDYDLLEGFLFRIYRKWKRNSTKVPDKLLYTALDQFRSVAEQDLAALLRQELWELVGRYGEAKRRAGQLDFTDLLLLVRDLVKENQAVRAYLQNKYTHLYVDEFQDTDPLQAEILLLLAADRASDADAFKARPVAGKLFLVGDPKQSIYKFRRADVQMYQAVSAILAGRGVGVVQLSRSFRSVPAIQGAVNAAFGPEMQGDAESAQARYVPLTAFRENIDGQPALIALPVPEPYGMRMVSNKSIDACLPRTITGFVEWLLKSSGWRVSDPENGGAPAPVAARHVCILFRRFTNWGADLTRDYVRSLEDRGIAHLLVGSKTFHWREEVETMRAALSAIEWPEDELAVFATLRGALFSIPDHILLRFRHEHAALHPFREWPEALDAEYEPVREALTLIGELHGQRNRRPIAETVYKLLEAGRAWAGFAFRPAGNQVLANVRRIIDLARQFETGGGFSFRGFVEELAAQAERSESAEAPVLEEGADGVRIMTVHAAKGLEFPVVILADMTARISHETPDKHVQPSAGLCAMRLLGCSPFELMQNEDEEKRREHAEGIRVAYVAATRARDLLVVPAVGDEEREGWISPLNKAIYPEKQRYRQAAAAEGCPAFGPETVLARPPGSEDTTGVKPGLHYGRAGNTPVVWWDPALLPASHEEYFSDRQTEILAEDAEAEQRGEEEHARWLALRAERLEAGGKPSIASMIASEAQEGPPGYECELHVELAPRHAERPSGKRFGALVHGALRDVALDASREEIAATVQLHARLLGAEDEEAEEARFAVYHALHHPLLERARAAAQVYREYPVTVHRDGVAVEGVIDLAFAEEGRWVIVDFKTDAETSGLAAEYKAQLAWYALAMQRTKGQAVQCYLLAV
ncbi:MAG: UvrD-helicase domain-containing protein [Bryobacterales bacterium]|nr:UvrD-helicase domain-containing protein [Bryobacterales bacterium]